MTSILDFAAKLDEKKYYVASEKKTLTRVKSPLKSISDRNQSMADWKPQGLWFGQGSSWLNFLRYQAEVFEEKWAADRLADYKNLYEITLTEDVKHVKNKKDALDFTEQYGVQLLSRCRQYKVPFLIDWTKVIKDYNGIRIFYGNYTKHFMWLDQWDCNSGCAFNQEAVKSIERVWKK